MKLGFAKNDITPRVGVELCGFGPYNCRHSTAVRDRLWARAMAVEFGQTRAVVVSCDLIGTNARIVDRVRDLVTQHTGVPPDAVMVHSTHTHSGPATGSYIGWGEADRPYVETLPQRIAKAAIEAFGRLQEATLSHAEVPCEGMGTNRVHSQWSSLGDSGLDDSWRPEKPELTDTTCHVIKAEAAGRTVGFLSYFGCHPVVCCGGNRAIHGDYCGVATNMLEREHGGAVGLFLQGAQGDINTSVARADQQEGLLALDVMAARYANAVRRGLRAVEPIKVDALKCERRQAAFSRKPWGLEKLRAMLAEKEALVHAIDATDHDKAGEDGRCNTRMETVYMLALRRMVAAAEAGESLSPPAELQGFRIGPVSLLGTPFEVFQEIKNDAHAKAASPIPLVLGLTNDTLGYAPDRVAAKGGYEADMVPMICGALPFADIHEELVNALLELDAALQ